MNSDTYLWIPYRAGLIKTMVDQVTVDQLAFGRARLYGWSPDDGKRTNLGAFKTQEEAERAVVAARRKIS